MAAASKNNSSNKVRLVSFEFSNIGTFDSDIKHIINFEDKNNIISMFGKNNSGKTSLINAIIFAIYERAPNVDVKMRQYIINNQSSVFKCSLIFIVNDMKHILNREGKKDPYESISQLDIYEKNGEITNYKNKDMENIIETLFGKYDIAMHMNFHIIKQDQYISNMKPKERKTFIEKVCGINSGELTKIINYVNPLLSDIVGHTIELKMKKSGIDIMVTRDGRERPIEFSGNHIIKIIDIVLGFGLMQNRNSHMDAIFIDNNINSIDIETIKDMVDTLTKHIHTIIIVSPYESINKVSTQPYIIKDKSISLLLKP